MAGRRIAYRQKRKQNRFSIMLVGIVVLILTGVVAVRSIELNEKKAVYEEKIALLEEQIAEEQQRAEEIAEYKKYTQTKKYVEEVAKDKLGLVYEGEIVFKEEK